MWASIVLFGVAILAALGLFLFGRRRPLMVRLGLRNAVRHRRQTATVVAGLLVGTMVICASLVAGDSLEAGLRETAIGALDETDVIVRVPGNLHVPASLMREIAEPLPADAAGASALLLEVAAVEHRAADLYEPGAFVAGFDPVEDRPFGPFMDTATGTETFAEDLGADEVLVNQRLADKLEIVPGDTIRLTYAEPFLPLVPVFHWLNGTLVSASAVPQPDGSFVYGHAPNDVYERFFDVPPVAERIAAVVFWPDPANATDLDIELVDPSGRSFVASEGSHVPSPRAPVDSPVPLPVPDEDPLRDQGVAGRENPTFLVIDAQNVSAGDWTLRVHAKSASNQDYFAFAAVFLPEYDLQRALAVYEELGEGAFGEVAEGAFGADAVPDVANLTSGNTADFTVARIVAMQGKASFFYADGVFMRLDTAQRIFAAEDQVNWLRFTGPGDAVAGLGSGSSIKQEVEDRIAALAEARGAGPSSPERNLEAVTLKQDFLEASEQAAGMFTSFLTLIGSFAIVSGIMLIINIFSMLAEERRHELGISRAVGMTRRDLIAAFTFEGTIYTLGAAAAGVLAGMVLAWLLVQGINTLAPPDSFFQIPFRPSLLSVAVAFVLGSLMTFATVLFASWRASRLDIAQAIRGEEDHPKKTDQKRIRRIALFLGLVSGLVVLGFLFDVFTIKTVGPPLILFALGPLLGLWMRTDRAWATIGAAVVLYVPSSFLLLEMPANTEGDASAAIRGLLLVIGATVLLVNLDRPSRWLASMLGRIRGFAAMARVATTYPLERRFRTGLTLSMYGLVILVITMFSIFFSVFTPDITRDTGGYDIVGESRVPVVDLSTVDGVVGLAGTDEDPFLGVASVHRLLDHFEFGSERYLIDGEPPGEFNPDNLRVLGFDAAFAEENGFPLHVWDDSLGDDERDVWRAVLEDTRLVIVSHSLVVDLNAEDALRGGPGSIFTLNTTGGQVDYVIAGVMQQHFFGGVWMAQAEAERSFADQEGLWLITLDEGTDPDAAAKRFERAFRDIGMDASSVEEEAREFDQQSTRIFQLLSAYLGLGLVVGVASIGIMTSRAVLERRRELGMLKAIGFTRRTVAGAMLLEVVLILATAAVIGVGLGIVVAYAIFTTQVTALPGVEFTIPWSDILGLLGLALVATILATIVPLKRAADLPAAEALRTVE